MTPEFTNIDEIILTKYLLGEADPAEISAVDGWLGQNPANRGSMEQLSKILRYGGLGDIEVPDAFESLGRLYLRMDKPGARVVVLPWGHLLSIAASLITLAILGVFILGLMRSNITDISSSAAVLREKLPDGSVVHLNRRSRLQYREALDGKTRFVELDGEAYFRVSPDSLKPFVIHASGTEITVVGTEFNVRTAFGQTRVEVTDGKVKVNSGAGSIYLVAGENVVVSEMEKKLTRGKNRGKIYAYYATGELDCQATPLSVLAVTLSERFSVPIRFGDPEIGKLSITARIRSENLSEIIQLICDTFELRAKKDRGEILLYR